MTNKVDVLATDEPQRVMLTQVIDSDMCVACGACLHVCPENNIEPAYSYQRGCHEVRILDLSQCSGCSEPCAEVCPSYEIDFLSLLANERRSAESKLGPIDGVFTGYSRHHADNPRSSSGGLLRAISTLALSKGAAIVCVSDSKTSYKNYIPDLVANKGQVESLPGSLYHSVDLTGAIDLIRRADKQIVLVAIPCQLAGVIKYIRAFDRCLEKKIYLKVGIICGWMYSDRSLDLFAKYNGLKDGFQHVSYRGESESGRLKITTHDGTLRSFRRRHHGSVLEKFKYKAAFSTDMNRLRCRVCVDHTNILADISVGDAWLARKNGSKESLVVVRSSKGREIIDELVGDDDLTLESGSTDDILESQSENLVFGQSARRVSEYRTSTGAFVPQFSLGHADEGYSGPGNTGVDSGIFFEMVRRNLIRKGGYRRYLFLYLFKFLFAETQYLVVRAARLRNKILKGSI